ncbi:MAG: TetR/AcrR family transcriptional regulator [Comamonadaceae bacterium]|nr:TetR family transcriptional regulator [Rubrivivax sp.]NLZ39996.1 TetR/AcrR family transcriptional regulator [Comamonadaceae bacterium]
MGTGVRDPQRTRRRILDAAKAEFARHGLGGARVDRIAAAAGANKRMLYYYFGGKDDLFLAVLEEAYRDIRSAEHALDLEHADPRAALRRLVDFSWRYLLQHPQLQSLLASENLDHGRNLARSRHVRELHSPLVAMLRDILQRGERMGLFRSGIDPVQLYISIAAEGYFYLSNCHTLSRIFGRDLMAPRALAARARHVRAFVLNATRR